MPGTSLITPAVLGLAEGYVQVKALGPVPVRGLDAPVEVFALLGASGVRRRLQAAALRGLTRFVGRDTELAAMAQALERAGAGQGQVVAVVGEAGVGKSRLVYECLHSPRTQGWRVLESASVSYGKATPYFPVVELLKRYVHVEDADDPRTIRAKVTGQVLTLDETMQEAIPALLWLLDALPDDSPFRSFDPPQQRQRLLDALQRVLLRESQAQPLLLVFEDLHWIDTETQALLDRLVDSLPTARLLLLVNYRPEYQHSWGSKTYYTQLRLDPLPPGRAADLPVFFSIMAAALGAVYTLGGRLAGAVPLLTRALEQNVATGAVVFQALCSLPLGEAHLLAGRLEEAHALAERTLVLARAHQERGHEAYALRLLGAIAAHRHPPACESAEAHSRQALALAEALGMRPLQAHCHRGLGTLYAVTGQREQARAALSAAITLYRAMGMTFWLPQAEAALAQVQ